MSDLSYGMTEEQFETLDKTRHLVTVLAELGVSNFKNDSIQISPESLGVVFAMIKDNLDMDYQAIRQPQ